MMVLVNRLFFPNVCFAIQCFTRKHITGQALSEKKVPEDLKSWQNAGNYIFSHVHLEGLRHRLTLNRNNTYLSP